MRRSALALALTLALAAVCGGTAAAAPASEPDPVAWFSYDRPAEHGAVQTPVDLPLRDGAALGCGLTLPARGSAPAGGRFPVVIDNTTPYGPAYERTDDFWAPRGYAYLSCNPRGTMSSLQAAPQTAGTSDPFSPQEARDWYDMVEWAAKQSWSNGRVGMTGYSYGGISTYLAASQRPPHLVAIAPGAAFHDSYDDIFYPGGIRGLDVQGWEAGLSSAPQRNPAYRQHPLRDRFWAERSVADRLPAVRASRIPVLTYSGWYDIFQQGTPRNHAALPGQSWLVMSGGGHLNGAESVPVNGRLAWFDRWLKRMPKAPLPAARVTSQQMPSNDDPAWRTHASWPPAGASTVRLALASDGSADRSPGAAGSRTYTVDPSDGRAHYWHAPRPDDAGQDQRVADARRQVYDTAPVSRDVEIAGPITANVRAALSATDGNLVVRLMDVAPDGTSTLITTGYLKASHRLGHAKAAPVVPGRAETYRVQVWPTDWRLAKGHQLRVSVSSGDVPRIEPDAPLGTVTVLTGRGGSSVDLPVLGGASGLR